MSTCNLLDLETLGSQPHMHKSLHKHCCRHGFFVQLAVRRGHGYTLVARWPWPQEVELGRESLFEVLIYERHSCNGRSDHSCSEEYGQGK